MKVNGQVGLGSPCDLVETLPTSTDTSEFKPGETYFSSAQV